MSLLIAIVAVVAGFAGLIWSADRFVLGASTTARNLGVSPLVIGLTIVAFGTSSPEIFTSGSAAINGSPEIALANVLGSNIANVGLVLGVTLLISPITIPKGLIREQLPILLLLTAICYFLLFDLRLNASDGFILLICLVVFGWNIYRTHVAGTPGSDEPSALVVESEVEGFLAPISTKKALLLMFAGLILMILGSNVLIYGAKGIAAVLGIPEFVIGLTVVAVGTSLPELATTITSLRKGHDDLALGNIIGSNILNILLVLPVPAFLSPFVIAPSVVWRDYMIMALLTALLCALIVVMNRRTQTLGRTTGAVLLLIYIAYTAFVLLDS